MSDPHIDIDDIDNLKPNAAPAQETGNSTDTPRFSGPDDFDWEEVDRGSRRNNNPFRFFQERAGFGLGTGALEDLLPDEARQHFRTSQREFLLGWRTVLDRAIQRIDNRDERDQEIPRASNSNPNKIIIEELDM